MVEANSVILRPVAYSDRQFIVDAYADWPNDYLGHEKVHKLIRRWIERGDKKCLVAEDNKISVGFIVYEVQFFGAWIHNLVIHPLFRGKDYGLTIGRLLKDKLVSEGVMVAGFKPLPGMFQDKFKDNLITWDTEL